MAVLPDVDGDGIADYAVSDLGSGKHAGTVDVFSGATGATVFTLAGSGTGTFGVSAASAGDVDGDQVPDLLVGDSDYDDPLQPYAIEGVVRLHSGRDGSSLKTYGGAWHGCALGSLVAGLDDVDGDGTPDFLASANDPATPADGDLRIHAISGATGGELYAVDLDLVRSVRTGTDRDGDGLRDFVVGRWESEWHGAVRVCSAKSGARILEFATAGAKNVAEVVDLDADGVRDLAVTHLDTSSGEIVLYVNVYSGSTGLVLAANLVGSDFDRIRDVDADGVDDWIIGGLDGSRILSTAKSVLYSDPSLPSTIRSIGDLDADGLDDYLVGFPGEIDASGVQRGAVQVRSGNDFWLSALPKSSWPGDSQELVSRGVASGNLIGVAVVEISGTPLFQFLAFGPADATEALVLAGVVPPGLSGSTATFQSFAVGRNGGIVDSARELVVFQ